jgi:hypothetical protein
MWPGRLGDHEIQALNSSNNTRPCDIPREMDDLRDYVNVFYSIWELFLKFIEVFNFYPSNQFKWRSNKYN